MTDTLRILVVDDDEVDRLAIRRALRGVRCEIDEEVSARGVVERLAARRYDCVILDHSLPGEDGLSLLKRIREAGIATSVLVVTGVEEGVAASLIAAGASDYLSKADVSAPHVLQRRLRFAIRVGQAEERARVAAHALVSERRLLGAVIEQMPAAVFIADTHGRLIFSNELARTFCGEFETAEGLMGCKAIWEDGRLVEPLEWPLIRALREDTTVTGVEMQIQTPSGSLLYVRAIAAPVRGANGERVAAVMVLDDWTEERRAKDAMQRAVRVREEVLAVVSHDLRNPIHAIGVAIDELADPTLGQEERARYVSAVRRTLKRADRLIQDLLDASRIEVGALAVSPVRASVRNIVDLAVKEHEVLAGEVGMKIAVSLTDAVVLADRDRVVQVLGNLIGNALRYARGGATIELGAERRDTAVWISVCDRGPGIAPDALPRIFDRFYQADRQRRTGAGLGLAIAEGIVRAHGGTIEARNRVGGGAEFRFSLPLDV